MSTKIGGSVVKSKEYYDRKIEKYKYKIGQLIKQNPGLLDKLAEKGQLMQGGSCCDGQNNNHSNKMKVIDFDSEMFRD